MDPGCTAIDNIDGVVPCITQTVNVNTSVAGTYYVTYKAVDASGNEATLTIEINVVSETIVELSAYYSSADSLTGEALLLQLRNIINTGMIKVSYGDSRYILDETDRDPINSANVILIYLGTSVSGVWDNGITWNREHVWPQSLLGVSVTNTSKNEGSDLHNLKPANPSINSSRGNKYYDNVTTTVSFAPRDEVKGDIARILFYMITMYSRYSLVNTLPEVNQMAMYATLLSWHYEDPVDDFERNRNNVIYTYQKNRNPYIDYPHFITEIWGTA